MSRSNHKTIEPVVNVDVDVAPEQPLVEAPEQSLDEVLAQMSTKSERIRYLTSLGWKRSDIAKHLGILYQHVRNVQLQVLKRLVNKT